MKKSILIFILSVSVFLCELLAQPPKLVNVSVVSDDLKISISFHDVFIWEKAKFRSIKTFPSDPPLAPETHHELWFGSFDKAVLDWFQFDYVENGKYKVIDSSNVEVQLFGREKIIGHLNPESNLLNFDSLDYIPFLQVPKFILEKSQDLKTWEKITLQQSSNEYQWAKGLRINLKLDFNNNYFYRVRLQKD